MTVLGEPGINDGIPKPSAERAKPWSKAMDFMDKARAKQGNFFTSLGAKTETLDDRLFILNFQGGNGSSKKDTVAINNDGVLKLDRWDGIRLDGGDVNDTHGDNPFKASASLRAMVKTGIESVTREPSVPDSYSTTYSIRDASGKVVKAFFSREESPTVTENAVYESVLRSQRDHPLSGLQNLPFSEQDRLTKQFARDFMGSSGNK